MRIRRFSRLGGGIQGQLMVKGLRRKTQGSLGKLNPTDFNLSHPVLLSLRRSLGRRRKSGK